jgi:predicted dehydrogenase
MLGQVRLVRAWFSFALSDDRNIRLSPTLGGGSLWDVGSYPVSFCQAVAGSDPVEVYAQARVHTNGVENGMAAQLIYANGLVAQIDCGFDVPGRRGAEVVGSLGTATIPDPWQPDISGTNAQIRLSVGDAETIIRPTPVNPYLSEIEALERAILDGLPLTYTVAQSCGNIATIVALYRSAAEGRAVRVQP